MDERPLEAQGGSSKSTIAANMKKMDPSSFSYADFLQQLADEEAATESKGSGRARDALATVADSRFDDKENVKKHSFIALNANGNLGMLFQSVARYLAARGGWKRLKPGASRFDMILGEAQAKGIPYGRFSQCFRYDYGITPMCNFYKGFSFLCRKVPMVQTLRHWSANGGTGFEVDEHVPESYCFFPSAPERSETDALRSAFEAAEKAGSSQHNAWIMKPSDGCKGHHIQVQDNLDEMLSFLEAREKGTISYVVQRYVERPLLLHGGRKFDMRYWVLLDSKYNGYLYKDGVCRTSSVPFTMDDLSDRFVHLSNHCIQEEHEDYGVYEPTNEMFFEEFAKWIDAEHGDRAFADKIAPQVHMLVRETLLAAKEKLFTVEHADYNSFNVFGYDFLVDADLKVWLLEVNSSPAVAEDLLQQFTKDLVEIAIDPCFPVDESQLTPSKAGADTTDENRFELILSADEGAQLDFGFKDTPKKKKANKK